MTKSNGTRPWVYEDYRPPPRFDWDGLPSAVLSLTEREGKQLLVPCPEGRSLESHCRSIRNTLARCNLTRRHGVYTHKVDVKDERGRLRRGLVIQYKDPEDDTRCKSK